MKKIVTSLAVILAFGVALKAQPYKNSAGLVFTPDFSGGSPIVSVQWKHFLNTTNNLDIRAAYQFNWGPDLSALFEWNIPFSESGLSFYAGPGVHIGMVTDYYSNREASFEFGLAGAVGFEYLFRQSPFALSLDWHPYLTWQPAIDDKVGFGWCSFQIGAKYCF